MGSSWTQNFYHAVFATRLRAPWITPEVETRLHPFLGGIAKDLDCTPIAINGMADHIHVLVRFPSDLAPADLLRHLKSRSSKWVHQTFPSLSDFGWQEGYGGFTVSRPSVDEVERYIRDQKEHHKDMPFEAEYIAMLRKTGWGGNAEDVFM
ncbi:MAG: IS200/IS605 family transposase [Phycisphaeraceae bacterium]|nr:IS200/IS605 family transposase [Phycisphaeraceae bacterium]MBX3366392.1 IS200/IS605 family transposase [Phycisphaeraceae bacterium]